MICFVATISTYLYSFWIQFVIIRLGDGGKLGLRTLEKMRTFLKILIRDICECHSLSLARGHGFDRSTRPVHVTPRLTHSLSLIDDPRLRQPR